MSIKFIPSDTFKNGCAPCANQKVSIFNPDGKTTVEYTVESSYQAGNSFLFVRDTSIEIEENETSSLGCTEKPTRTKSTPQDTGKQDLRNFLCRKKVNYKNTPEKERRLREKEYERRVKEALQNRKVWKDLMNSLEKIKIKAVVDSRGPEWYQDLSHKQIKSLRMLQATLKADLEEGIVARTKRLLTSLGVTVNIPSGNVYRSNRDCDSDPVCFLLDIYNVVVETEAKTRPDLGINEYSVNQRLLLSSICTLHLPVLINLMHLMLPPPLPGSIALVETLYNSERYRYSQPHLEPLPNRTTKWFNQLTKQEMVTHQRSSAEESEHPDKGDEEEDGNIQRMLSICEEKQEQADSRWADYKLTKFHIASKKFYVRRNTYERERNVSTDLAEKIVHHSNASEYSVSSVPKVNQVLASVEGARLSVRPPDVVQNSQFTSDDSTATEQHMSLLDSDRDYRESVEVGVVNVTSKHQNSYNNEEEVSSLLQQQQQQQQLRNSFMKMKVTTKPSVDCSTSLHLEGGSNLITKPQESVTVDSERNRNATSGSLNQQEVKSVTSESKQSEPDKEKIQAMLDKIAATPVKQQLQCVISLLAEVGDPLALFPEVHRIPSVKRWFELRRGIKRTLTEKENDKLIQLTTDMWKNTPVVKKLKIPKLDIPKDEQKLLTWNDQHRVRKKVNEQLSLYFTQLKEQKVNNTRALFPTMLNQYYVSKLNRQFRKVFYTYLPARAADVYVYKPWQLEECKPKQKSCY